MKFGTKKCWNPLMPLRVGRQSASRFCMFMKLRSNRKVAGHVPVYLNVYDLTPLNGYVYWAGVGVFHSGVEGKNCFFFCYTLQLQLED
ncbi:DeSI-like protein [Platanthera guangdongensis]|uniref:DeSI-like protein n=1 Tax=Platanthera guangdongensis TaxID=2320717 RepID=A0ABR2LJZ7_9ASPA